MLAGLVGADPALQKIRQSLPSLAARRTPLVIIGEAGVGKALVAAHIHEHSDLHINPLTHLNATTLDERDQRIGLFGGEPRMLSTTRRSILENQTTVVLKHVDYLPPHLQDELARVLSAQNVRRHGSSETRAVLCRTIITVRNRLSALQKRGRLTNELHQLLRSFQSISIPPLRRRQGDIPILVMFFMRQFHRERSGSGPFFRGIAAPDTIDRKLITLLKRHPWTGNIMELKVFVRSLLVLPYSELLRTTEMQEINSMIAHVEEGKEFSLEAAMNRVRQAVVKRAIESCNGNIRKAGQLLGMSESAMHRRKALLVIVVNLLSTDPASIDFIQFLISLA